MFFFFKITGPSNNFEFSKLPLPTLKEFNFPGNFVFVRLQIKFFSNCLGNHFRRHGTQWNPAHTTATQHHPNPPRRLPRRVQHARARSTTKVWQHKTNAKDKVNLNPNAWWWWWCGVGWGGVGWQCGVVWWQCGGVMTAFGQTASGQIGLNRLVTCLGQYRFRPNWTKPAKTVSGQFGLGPASRHRRTPSRRTAQHFQTRLF